MRLVAVSDTDDWGWKRIVIVQDDGSPSVGLPVAGVAPAMVAPLPLGVQVEVLPTVTE